MPSTINANDPRPKRATKSWIEIASPLFGVRNDNSLSKYAQRNRYRRLDKRIYVSVRLVPVLVKFADFD